MRKRHRRPRVRKRFRRQLQGLGRPDPAPAGRQIRSAKPPADRDPIIFDLGSGRTGTRVASRELADRQILVVEGSP